MNPATLRFLTSQPLDGPRVAIDQSGELLRPFERHQLVELGLSLLALAARFDADRRGYFRDNVAKAATTDAVVRLAVLANVQKGRREMRFNFETANAAFKMRHQTALTRIDVLLTRQHDAVNCEPVAAIPPFVEPGNPGIPTKVSSNVLTSGVPVPTTLLQAKMTFVPLTVQVIPVSEVDVLKVKSSRMLKMSQLPDKSR